MSLPCYNITRTFSICGVTRYSVITFKIVIERRFCTSWEINARYLLFIVWPRAASSQNARVRFTLSPWESSTYGLKTLCGIVVCDEIYAMRVGESWLSQQRPECVCVYARELGICAELCGAWRDGKMRPKRFVWESAFCLAFFKPTTRNARVPTILTQRRRLIRADNPRAVLPCAFICKRCFEPEFIQASSFAVCIANVYAPRFSFSIFTRFSFVQLLK